MQMGVVRTCSLTDRCSSKSDLEAWCIAGFLIIWFYLMHFVPAGFFPQLRENKPGTFDVPRGSLHLAEAQTWRKMNEFLLALVPGHLLLNHMLCIFVKSVPGSITFIQSCRILLEFNSVLFVQCSIKEQECILPSQLSIFTSLGSKRFPIALKMGVFLSCTTLHQRG